MKESVFCTRQDWKDIQPQYCGWEQCSPGHSFGPTVRTAYLLHYVVSGKGTYTVNGATYSLGGGDIFVIRPYEKTFYQADDKEPWTYIWVAFSASIALPAALKQDSLHLPQAQEIFEQIIEAADASAGKDARVCGYLWQLLGLLFSLEDASKDTGSQIIDQAVAYIEAEYFHPLPIAALAAHFHLDRSYFSTLFKEKVGCSPQQYLVQLRLKRAAELMVRHGYLPGEAAVVVGYPDGSSFSRSFKQHFGESPTVYCKNHQTQGYT